MGYDTDKVDEATLALLYLNLFEDRCSARAWKSMPWEAMDRLHEKDLIGDPKSKAKSVVLTEEGLIAAEEAFRSCSDPHSLDGPQDSRSIGGGATLFASKHHTPAHDDAMWRPGRDSNASLKIGNYRIILHTKPAFPGPSGPKPHI